MKTNNIEFRAKLLNTKTWVYGAPHIYEQGALLLSEDDRGKPILHKIYPETIGQFTGKHDDRNKKIFSNDVLNDNALVYWDDKYADWRVRCDAGNFTLYRYLQQIDTVVRGNTIDNPELMEGRL